jgi:hypothetical protein
MRPIATPEALRLLTGPRQQSLLVVTLAVILTLPWITGSTASATREASTVTHQEQDPPTWRTYQDDAFRLSYPPTWDFEVTGEEDAATYQLRAPDKQETHVVVKRFEASAPTAALLERQFVRTIEADERLARRFIRILPPARIAGHLAARVQYAARTASGERVRGLWIGLLLPDRPALLFHLHAQTTRYFQVHTAPYKQMLASAARASTSFGLQ